jgi:ATP:cob(I)alamin adenosyltransferase
MAIKPTKNLDELCYPFIFEPGPLCDYEVATDELCALIGAILAELPAEFADIQNDLEQLQPLAFHLNGSIRGRLAISEDDIIWLQQRLTHYKTEVKDKISGFVLPRGTKPVPQLHQARSAAKKAIRWMVQIDATGLEVAMVLPRLANLMCNFFFTLTLVINQRRGVEEPEFISKSYGQ